LLPYSKSYSPSRREVDAIIIEKKKRSTLGTYSYPIYITASTIAGMKDSRLRNRDCCLHPKNSIEQEANVHLVPKDAGEKAATELAVTTRAAMTFMVTIFFL